MNLTWPHIHLIINHAPVFAIITGVVVLVLTLFIRRPGMLRTACLFLAVGGALAVPVYFTGEPTEESLERSYAVSDAFIEPHEDAALLAMIGAIVVGVLALGALILPQSRRPRPAMTLILALLAVGLVDAVLIARAANFGGEIRHPEIRPDSGATAQLDAASLREDDDDD